MRNSPSALDLLAIARKVIRDDIAPALSGGDRYRALMAANAIAIASRQLAETPSPTEANLAALKADIRRGDLDPGTHAQLLALVKTKLSESNPKYLPA